MSKFREKSEYMAMRVSGFLGWLHRLVMLITFPIRKFWMIVAVLAVVLIILIAIPMFYGIPLRDVWDWYMIKMPNHEFVAAKDKTLFGAKDQVDKLRRTFSEIVPNKKSGTPEKTKEAKKKTRLVSWHVAEFKKAKYKPLPATPVIEKVKDIKDKIVEAISPEPDSVVVEQQEVQPIENVIITDNRYATEEPESEVVVANNESEDNEETIPKEDEAEFEAINIEDYYTKLRSADLTYFNPPEIFEGEVRVSGPNTIYVDGTFMFLYGIYSHPLRHDIDGATAYLKSIAEGNRAYCYAVAYSQKTQSPASLCFVNGVLINKALVEHKFAQSVALK